MVSEITSSLIGAAKADALHAYGGCEDMGAVLFPKGKRLPSEELQAAVGTKLHDVILSIERVLSPVSVETGYSRIWQKMARAGSLRNIHLMSFAFARVSEEQISNRLSSLQSGAALAFLPARLIGHNSESIAELARKVLIAEQASRSPQISSYTQLQPSLLLHLVWQVAEALYAEEGEDSGAIKSNAQALLAHHQAVSQIGVAAQKLLFALSSDYKADLRDPAKAGLPMYVAALAREFILSFDSVVRIIDADTAAPLAMLLALRNSERETAFSYIQMLRGSTRDDDEIADILENLDKVSPEMADEFLSLWRRSEGDGDEA